MDTRFFFSLLCHNTIQKRKPSSLHLLFKQQRCQATWTQTSWLDLTSNKHPLASSSILRCVWHGCLALVWPCCKMFWGEVLRGKHWTAKLYTSMTFSAYIWNSSVLFLTDSYPIICRRSSSVMIYAWRQNVKQRK